MNAVTPAAPPRQAVAPAGTTQVLRPQTFGELTQFAAMASKSQLVPSAFRGKPEDIMLAVQMGSELGLAPMQALQGIAVINGRPSIWGDALIGLVRRDSRCEDIIETFEGDGETRKARCVVSRSGSTAVVAEFSVADAKKAALWGKQGPWQQYPDRMLRMRARSFACRDAFPDVLRGLIAAEEAQDIPIDRAPAPRSTDTFAGPTIDHTPSAEPVPSQRPAGLRQWLDGLLAEIRACQTDDELHAIAGNSELEQRRMKLRAGTPAQRAADDEIAAAYGARYAELSMPADE